MFNFESMYGATEELWFPNNDLGGPYWSDSPVARRSYANSPHKFVKNWDMPILIFSGQRDFRIPYTESLQAFTAARLMACRAGWFRSRTRRIRYSSRRIRSYGTANFSAGSTVTSRMPKLRRNRPGDRSSAGSG